MSLRTIETYGQVCALLDDGSGTRADLLAGAGLDEAGWQRLRAKCLRMLSENQAPATSIAFGRAYASARQQLAAPKAAPPPRSLPPVSAPGDAPSPGVEPRTLDVDRTTDQAFPLAGPALPFRAPAQAARRKRLLHFEPSTGCRLSPPVWVDELDFPG